MRWVPSSLVATNARKAVVFACPLSSYPVVQSMSEICVAEEVSSLQRHRYPYQDQQSWEFFPNFFKRKKKLNSGHKFCNRFSASTKSGNYRKRIGGRVTCSLGPGGKILIPVGISNYSPCSMLTRNRNH